MKTDTQNNSAEYDIIDEFYPQDDDLQTLLTSFNLELENYYANESVYENRTIDVANWLLEAYLNTNFDFVEHPLKNVERDTLSIEIEKDLMGLAIGESIIESYFSIKNEINSEISDSKKLYYIDIYGLQENENNFELMAVLAFGTFNGNHTWTNTLNPINYSTCGYEPCSPNFLSNYPALPEEIENNVNRLESSKRSHVKLIANIIDPNIDNSVFSAGELDEIAGGGCYGGNNKIWHHWTNETLNPNRSNNYNTEANNIVQFAKNGYGGTSKLFGIDMRKELNGSGVWHPADCPNQSIHSFTNIIYTLLYREYPMHPNNLLQ